MVDKKKINRLYINRFYIKKNSVYRFGNIKKNRSRLFLKQLTLGELMISAERALQSVATLLARKCERAAQLSMRGASSRCAAPRRPPAGPSCEREGASVAGLMKLTLLISWWIL